MSDAPVGHVIRAARKKMGLTQTALADRLGVSASYVNLIERDRRRLTGERLNAVSAILDLEPGALDGEMERQLLRDLDELTSDPAVADLALDTAETRDLVARHGSWARALVSLRRASQRDQNLVAAFSDRLNHDPVLNESMHEMLNASTAVRSVADIYAEAPDLAPEYRARFDSILIEEATRLSEVVQSLAGFFERNETPGAAFNAAEEIDDFLYERSNYFPDIEARMEAVFGDDQPPSTDTLAGLLSDRHGISIRRLPVSALPKKSLRLVHLDDANRELILAEGLPRTTERFEIARQLAAREVAESVSAEIEGVTTLRSEESANRLRKALTAYAAACLVMPYRAFHEATENARYDIDALGMMFDVSPEQLCHRFTTLRRPGSEGVPFAFLRANAAGYLTKRFPLPRFSIPRFGGACPLWAVYSAMQTPDLRQRQLAELPSGDRFFIIARATRPIASTFGRRQPGYALMLACDALNADRLVYSDGLDLTAAAEPIGPTCLLCPRDDCAYRQEPSVRTRA